MTECAATTPDGTELEFCNLAPGHAGRHSWETEEQFLDRVAPDVDLEAKNPVPERQAVVDLGAHYRARGGVEPIDFITSNNLTFCEGNVVKYVARWKAKNGLEDLRKARWYIDRLIAQAEGEGK